MKLPFGPWSSCEWWKQLLESWDSFTASADSSDDMYLSVYKHIANDLGQDPELPPTCVLSVRMPNRVRRAFFIISCFVQPMEPALSPGLFRPFAGNFQ